MKRPYLWLALAVIAAAAVVTALGRAPADRRSEGVATAPVKRTVEVALQTRDGSVSPGLVRVEIGTHVRLTVSNTGTHRAALTLPGYEDRVRVPELDPGKSWTGEFLADRPGDDFAWAVNGKPAGRLVVSGSHLVEGHR